MPTYDYVCQSCGHAFESFHSMTAKPIRKCPSCGKLRVKRLIGIGAGVIFKGSGFYQTDYRSDSYRQAAQKDKPAEPAKSEGAKSEGAKTDGAKAEGAKDKSETRKSKSDKPSRPKT